MFAFSKKNFFALSLAVFSSLGLLLFKDRNEANAPGKETRKTVLTPSAREIYGQMLSVESSSDAETIVVTGLIASQTFFVPKRFATDCEKAYNGIIDRRDAAKKDLPPENKERLYIERLADEIARVGPEELCASRRAVDAKLLGENLKETIVFNDEQIALQAYAQKAALGRTSREECEACKKSARNLANAYKNLEKKGFPVRESGLILREIESAAQTPDLFCPRPVAPTKETRPLKTTPSRISRAAEPH